MPRQKYQNEGLIPRLFALVRQPNVTHINTKWNGVDMEGDQKLPVFLKQNTSHN